MPDVSRYRLIRAAEGAVIAAGQTALDHPFEVADGLPLHRLHWLAPSDGRSRRRISDVARFAGRRRRLRARLKKRRLLFADDEYAAELSARPEYYGVR